MIQEIITGITIQIPMLVIIIWGVKHIAERMPVWLSEYHRNQMKEIAMQRAVGMGK
jgi:hypothetical protein